MNTCSANKETKLSTIMHVTNKSIERNLQSYGKQGPLYKGL